MRPTTACKWICARSRARIGTRWGLSPPSAVLYAQLFLRITSHFKVCSFMKGCKQNGNLLYKRQIEPLYAVTDDLDSGWRSSTLPGQGALSPIHGMLPAQSCVCMLCLTSAGGVQW